MCRLPPHLRWQPDDAPNEYAPQAPHRATAPTAGVAFVDPVNPYTLADRATKYGLLFIALTFVAVGLFELMGVKPPRSPAARVAAPNSLFRLGATRRRKAARTKIGAVSAGGRGRLCNFLLLVSLSEHLPLFPGHYLAAATSL